MQGSTPDSSHLLDVAREALVVLSPAGRIRYWNRGAETMFGHPRAHATGRTLAELLGPGAALQREAMDQLASLGAWQGELVCIAADARMTRVHCVCEARFGESGNVVAIACAMSDVSEQRRAEKEIVLLHNLMEQRIRRRTAELEEMNEDLRDFAHSLAHDLRAPMASIDGFSAQLERKLEGALDDKCRHYLHRVRSGVKLMSDLTDGLLALSDVASADLLRQPVDLSQVARTVIERLHEADPGREISIAIHETPPVQGDVRLLTDVLQNLIGNAWKFTSRTRGARIEFGASRGEDGVQQYYVKDNGAGFDPEYAYKLFGPFQRLHAAHEFEGTGIGLAIVRKIVSRHGGRVWAESKPGEGATFYFTLGAS
jgi:PAS domain S-box-containing protein